MQVIDKLKSKLIFINGFIPYDFTSTMGQYALRVNYTNGDYDMFTTPMDSKRGNDTGDFKTVEEFYEAVKYLQDNGIKKVQE